MTVGVDPKALGDGLPQSAPRFSLLLSPFAVLGATPLTPLPDLTALAQADGTRDAGTALRTLSVPRTRLGAELGFLPGAARQADATLAALRRGERPELTALPPAARASVLAHLCAAAQATPDDQAELVALQGSPPAAELIAALDADRAVAGVPPVQPAALAAEQEALAERHAAALLDSCLAGADPPGRLAALVREAPAGAASAFLRKAAAGWARHSAAALTTAEAQAAAARLALLSARDEASVAGLCRDLGAWAALTAPQRLSDARAGLDHPASLRVLGPWRQAGITVAEEGRPDLALPLARALAAAFDDMPGEAVRLRNDVRACAQLVEDSTLDALLAPLRALADRLGAAPAGLDAALTEQRLGLYRKPFGLAPVAFGPTASGVAGELWRAFDAACAGAVESEAPWTIVRALAERIGGSHRPQGAPAALALHAGLLARAERSGRELLAARLRAEERGLQRAAALWIYQDYRNRRPASHKGRRTAASEVLGALRVLRDVTDDPAARDALVAEEPALLRQVRLGQAWIAGLVAAVAALFLVPYLDHAYTADPPYGHARAQALVVAQLPSRPDAQQPAPAPAPLPTSAAPAVTPRSLIDSMIANGRLPRPLAPSSPDLPEPAPPPLAPPVLTPGVPPDGPAPASLAFPTRTSLPEQQPRDPDRVYTLPEIRWCVFNEIRLQGATDAATTEAQQAGIEDLQSRWNAVCDTYRGHKFDLERTKRERERALARLHTEGAALLTGAAP